QIVETRFSETVTVARFEQLLAEVGRRGAADSARRPTVLLLGPDPSALSGGGAHLRTMLGSSLAENFELLHFQGGSGGRRDEGPLGRVARLLAGPWALRRAIRARRAALVHINATLNLRACLRDLPLLLAARASGARVLLQMHGGALPQDFFRGPLFTGL